MIESQITYDWKRVIETCYNSDPEMISKFHILAPTDVEKAVQHTLKTLFKASYTGTIKIYECAFDRKFMGYFGLEIIPIQNEGKIQVLTGFFIMPEFRTDECKKEFVDHLREQFPSKSILTYIFSKNTRARGFFARHGGQVLNTITNLIDGVGEAEYKLIVC